MNFIDICAGIGGFRLGLEQAGHKCIGFVEYDKYAVKSYRAMYDTEGEFYHDDITTIKSEDIPRADTWCFGFPCQDISVAGKQRGLNGSRSGIYFDIINLIKGKKEEDKPRWLLIENVKNLFSIDGGWGFARVLSELDEAGYDAEWQLLNSKNFGVPQNRERVFIIGHLRGRSGRKIFPIGQNDRKINIEIIGHSGSGGQKGYIHDTDGIVGSLSATDYKQLKQIMINQIGNIGTSKSFGGNSIDSINPTGLGISPTLNTCGGGNLEPKIILPKIAASRGRISDGKYEQTLEVNKNDLSNTLTSDQKDNLVVEPSREPKLIGGIGEKNFGKQFRQGNRVYDSEHIAMCLNAQPVGNAGGNSYLYKVPAKKETSLDETYLEKMIVQEGREMDALIEESEREIRSNGVDEFGREIKKTRIQSAIEPIIEKNNGVIPEAGDIYNKNPINNGIAKTLSTDCGHNGTAGATAVTSNSRIRKLTPKECFRLQGFPDEYFERAASVNSNRQLYKQAGNGVTVNVTYEIGKALKIAENCEMIEFPSKIDESKNMAS